MQLQALAVVRMADGLRIGVVRYAQDLKRSSEISATRKV
jgi:hypothetical protein